MADLIDLVQLLNSLGPDDVQVLIRGLMACFIVARAHVQNLEADCRLCNIMAQMTCVIEVCIAKSQFWGKAKRE